MKGALTMAHLCSAGAESGPGIVRIGSRRRWSGGLFDGRSVPTTVHIAGVHVQIHDTILQGARWTDIPARISSLQLVHQANQAAVEREFPQAD